VSLKIMLDKQNIERIFPPYLEITYEDKTADDILNAVEERYKEMKFVTEYNMDTTSFWKGVKTTFNILIAVLCLTRFVFMVIYQQQDRLDTDRTANFNLTLVRSFTELMDMFSTMFFWFLVGVTGWLFIFFKLQERVYYLIPSLNEATFLSDYKPYQGLLTALVVTKFVSLAYKIAYEQSAMDIYVIDWEAPKPMNSSKFSGHGVNPWRRLFVLNELNEL
jgi:hypothetical protein